MLTKHGPEGDKIKTNGTFGLTIGFWYSIGTFKREKKKLSRARARLSVCVCYD